MNINKAAQRYRRCAARTKDVFRYSNGGGDGGGDNMHAPDAGPER